MAQGTTVHRNGVDSWTGLDEEAAPEDRASARQLWIRSGERRAFLYFNRLAPPGSTIVNATLRVYAKGSWGSMETLEVRRTTERWGASHLTWNNQPDVGGTSWASVSKTSAADGDEWAFDLTAGMQAVSDGQNWYGLRIASTTLATQQAIYSAEGPAEFRPVLEVTWSQAPQAPTTLSPSGSRAVSIAKPVLRFDFTDTSGSTSMAALQVQIDPAGAFASPAFDSGTVAATEPELDLATTAYAGITNGTETRWRVRVQDGAGLWSPWSDPARFRRDNKGTLTIDNPPSSGLISEWTPPIIATLSGETLKSWQVYVTPVDDPTNRLWDSRRVKHTEAGNTLSRNIPKAIIEDDSDYRVVVRVWDSKDRESTPGDPVFTQAVREFHFNEDPTPNPATSLTAENLLPRPWVELNWQRATAPDSFTIKRDGKVIDSGIDPADVLVSGTAYRFRDKDAKPYRQHTWIVQSTVNGLTSTGNPSVTMKTQQQGVWLTDPEREVEVFLTGNDEGSWAMGEEGTNHAILNSDELVRIEQGKRGFEGTISGSIMTQLGVSVDTWENRLWDMKRRSEVLVLSLGNESFRCRIFNVVVSPTPTVPITKRVSFEFFQVGRPDFKR